MWVNIPILHALNPVYAAIPVIEGFVYMAPLIVVVLHVWVHFASYVCDRSCKQSLYYVRTNVVEVILVIIHCAREVVHVHDLGPCFGTPVLVQERVEGSGSRHWNDCFQVLASHSCSLPLCGALVGFSIQPNISVAPILGPQPLDGCMDT